MNHLSLRNQPAQTAAAKARTFPSTPNPDDAARRRADKNVRLPLLALLLGAGLLVGASLPAADGITNIRASQRPGTNLVDIRYDLGTINTEGLIVAVAVSTNGGLAYDLPATHFTGDVGFGVTAGTNKWVVWDAVRDWPDGFSTNVFFRITASDVAQGMALIPAGSFTMGNCMDPGEGDGDELPLHSVDVSAFYMDRYEVTKALWDEVYQWATNHGYSFEYGAQGKAANHPAHSITWYDAVKWCNARSEKEGRVPAYYTSAAQTAVYRTWQINVQNDWVKWTNGYRLPTEAEWEKAARGGVAGHRFPWSDTDKIQHSRANYYSTYSTSEYVYDSSPTPGYHPMFFNGVEPYSSPVGYFAANGYGLYDMAGNMWEWCWDWYSSGYYRGSPRRGPANNGAVAGARHCG
ncbi:MAG: SUMF1/EgtB/PvdO family nonheme iron enzyme [Verrucomicrobia bacterium]|nr:SUMF1/EgtB/PvdO family nonheme iron enzyme [Verrucomicrobiota bacterium]